MSYTEEQPGPLTTAAASGFGSDLYLRPDALLQGRHMRNHADELAVPVQPGQRIQRGVQRILIQRAEPFVEEKGVHPYRLAGHLRKPEGEGKAHDETLAAGQVFGGADFSGLIAVDDVELQRLLLVAEKQIPVGHAP